MDAGEAAAGEAEASAPGPLPGAVWVLSAAWALTFAALTSSISTLNLAGAKSGSPGASADTVPLATVLFFSGFGSALVAKAVDRVGRSRAYLVGAALGAVGSAVAAASVEAEAWPALVLACAVIGTSLSFAQNYRFATVSILPVDRQPAGVSAILTGGIFGAVVGPEYGKHSRDSLGREYVGVLVITCFIFVAVFALLALALRIPAPRQPSDPAGNTPRADEQKQTKLPWKQVFFADPRCWGATVVATGGQAIMALLMSPCPLAMKREGFTFDEVSTVIQCHMVLMYLPSYVTGSLIERFGSPVMGSIGVCVLAAAAAVLRSGTTLEHFFVGEGLLGVGWNFCFVSGTTQLAKCASLSAEPANVVAANDVILYVLSGVASVSSGALLDALGWADTQIVAIAALGVVGSAFAASEELGRRRATS